MKTLRTLYSLAFVSLVTFTHTAVSEQKAKVYTETEFISQTELKDVMGRSVNYVNELVELANKSLSPTESLRIEQYNFAELGYEYVQMSVTAPDQNPQYYVEPINFNHQFYEERAQILEERKIAAGLLNILAPADEKSWLNFNKFYETEVPPKDFYNPEGQVLRLKVIIKDQKNKPYRLEYVFLKGESGKYGMALIGLDFKGIGTDSARNLKITRALFPVVDQHNLEQLRQKAASELIEDSRTERPSREQKTDSCQSLITKNPQE